MRLRYVLVALTVAVAGCSAPALSSAPAVSVPVYTPPTVSAAPSPSASVLAVVTHKPAPTHSAKPKVIKPKPRSTHKAAPRPTGWVCYVGKPCTIPPLSSPVWHKTVGCTRAWRAALHRTTCPPGWPPIP